MMNNEFKKMMEEMVGTMMMSMMKETMMSMMSEMTGNNKPEVAKAEVTKPTIQTLSREDFLALTEEPIEEITKEPIKLLVNSTKTGLIFNQPVSKDIWTINYLTLKSKYPHVKYDKVTKGFRWNKADYNEFKIACRDYQEITVITKEYETILYKYYQEKARKKAEWYAGKADAYLDNMNGKI